MQLVVHDVTDNLGGFQDRLITDGIVIRGVPHGLDDVFNDEGWLSRNFTKALRTAMPVTRSDGIFLADRVHLRSPPIDLFSSATLSSSVCSRSGASKSSTT